MLSDEWWCQKDWYLSLQIFINNFSFFCHAMSLKKASSSSCSSQVANTRHTKKKYYYCEREITKRSIFLLLHSFSSHLFKSNCIRYTLIIFCHISMYLSLATLINRCWLSEMPSSCVKEINLLLLPHICVFFCVRSLNAIKERLSIAKLDLVSSFECFYVYGLTFHSKFHYLFGIYFNF